MGKLYFVRHGQTLWNVENKICGATDIALTPLGHEQAIRTGNEILKSGIQFDEIISSPLVFVNRKFSQTPIENSVTRCYIERP